MASLKAIGTAGLLLLATAGAADAAKHACAGDAIERAKKLIRFHAEVAANQQIGDGETAVTRPPVKVLSGKGKLDVLEVTSSIYKANYRMRFVYARIPGSCTLHGQEILEASNPY